MAKPTIIKSATPLVTVTNTIVETTLGTVTVPAFNLKTDYVITMSVALKTPTTNSTDELTLRLKIGSTVLATVGPFDAANNDVAWIRLNGFVNASTRLLHYIAEDGRTGTAADVEEVTDVTWNVNADVVITATAQWSVASASNIAVAKYFTLELQPVD